MHDKIIDQQKQTYKFNTIEIQYTVCNKQCCLQNSPRAVTAKRRVTEIVGQRVPDFSRPLGPMYFVGTAVQSSN